MIDYYETKRLTVAAVQVGDDIVESQQEVDILVTPCWPPVAVEVSGDSLLRLIGDGVGHPSQHVLASRGDWVLARQHPKSGAGSEVWVLANNDFRDHYTPVSPTPAPATDAEQEPEAYQPKDIQLCSTYEQTLIADAQRLQEAAQRLDETKQAWVAAQAAYATADREHQERVKALKAVRS